MISRARTDRNPWDAWLQRAAVAAMVTVGATLLAVGLTLYGLNP
jgi:hypothetical protein